MNTNRAVIAVQNRFNEAIDRLRDPDTAERGEGMVSWLIILVAVAALALVVWAAVEALIIDKTGQLDLGDTPAPAIP